MQTSTWSSSPQPSYHMVPLAPNIFPSFPSSYLKFKSEDSQNSHPNNRSYKQRASDVSNHQPQPASRSVHPPPTTSGLTPTPRPSSITVQPPTKPQDDVLRLREPNLQCVPLSSPPLQANTTHSLRPPRKRHSNPLRRPIPRPRYAPLSPSSPSFISQK